MSNESETSDGYIHDHVAYSHRVQLKISQKDECLMSNPRFRITRTALGLTAQEIADKVGKSVRTIRLYDAGTLDPAPEAAATTSQMIVDMAQKLEPYLNTRRNSHKTYVLYDYDNEDEFIDTAGDDYKGWTFSQYRTFLGHLIVLLEAKGLSYQLVQYERRGA